LFLEAPVAFFVFCKQKKN